MSSSSTVKDIPVFQAESIKAMSPLAQGIAAMLKDAGYIKIEKDKAEG